MWSFSVVHCWNGVQSFSLGGFWEARGGGGVLKPCLEGGVWWGVDKQCNVCTAPPNLKLVLF